MKVSGRLASAALWALCVVFVTAAIAARVLAEGRAALRESDAAFAAGDMAAATVAARRAAAAYVPFAAHVGPAYARLRTIARDAEGRGDHDAALFAWRAIRSAAIGSRWLDVPFAGERHDADIAIARLSAATREPAGAPRRSGSQAGQRMAATLARDEGPSRIGGLLILGGLACWIAGTVWMTSAPLRAEGRARARSPAALLLGLGVIGWSVGLLLG